MTDSIYMIWNFMDDIPVNFQNKIAFTKKEDAEDHLLDYMYGGLVVFQEDLQMKREWLDIVDSSETAGNGKTFGEKLLAHYLC